MNQSVVILKFGSKPAVNRAAPFDPALDRFVQNLLILFDGRNFGRS